MPPVLTAAQHRARDAAIVAHEAITSVQLMERATQAFVARLATHYPAARTSSLLIIAGPGNNGGDGLCAARLLRKRGYRRVDVCYLDFGTASADNQVQRSRLNTDTGFQTIKQAADLPDLTGYPLLVDAIFGTGLSRPAAGLPAEVIERINAATGPTVVALDLPSGLYTDRAPEGPIVRADRTLSLGLAKPALFAPASAPYLGRWELVDFAATEAALPAGVQEFMVDERTAAGGLKPRGAASHKGTFGHALLVAGSYGTVGAALLSARAILRSGVGLLTVHVPECGYSILQSGAPEAMVRTDASPTHCTRVRALEEAGRYRAVGIGPGLGKHAETLEALREVIDRAAEAGQPLVVDADALNLLAENQELLERLPAGSILTPHPKEFERSFGNTPNDYARWERQRERAAALNVVIVLKTNHTTVAAPDGSFSYNTTGNPGMGTGGTGDVLTGIITGLLAQDYQPATAARLGVYLHGLAGDLVAETIGQEALLAGDLVDHLGPAFRQLHAIRSQSPSS